MKKAFRSPTTNRGGPVPLYGALMLAALALVGCGGRYIPVPCLTHEQLGERERAEPPKIGDKLTGDAEKDIRPIAGSALRLRAWGKGNLELLRGCTG